MKSASGSAAEELDAITTPDSPDPRPTDKMIVDVEKGLRLEQS